MNNLVDRIFKNWKTTLIGLLIIIGSLGAVFAGKATLTEAGLFMVTSIPFFFLRDHTAKPGEKL